MNRSSSALSVAVFICGLASLGIEMSASRLLGNIFGTSNLVWANIIGLILLYLSAGYFLGGRWADRSPRAFTFFAIMAWAAISIAVIPVVSNPVLRFAANSMDTLDAGVLLGSFLGVLILFAAPVTLLGCISPFAVRLALRDMNAAGNVAGRLYALSTLGSIGGTFLPVLVLIPWIGTARTFFFFAALLLIMACIGLFAADSRKALWYLWMPVALAACYLLGTNQAIKNSNGQIFETESAYNYIQVLEFDGVRYLRLNEGQGIHSVYDPATLRTRGTWDYFVAAPFFNAAPHTLKQVRSLAIVGLAAGTTARQFTSVYGAIPIEGYEIDPAIIDIGKRYFAMDEPNLDAQAVDGRWGLEHSKYTFSVIAVDAYRPPYIPPHLVTREFFQIAYDRLEENGVLTINIARLPNDRRLIEAIAATVGSVFPSVYVADVPNSLNSILYATRARTAAQNLLINHAALADDPTTPAFLREALQDAILNLQPSPAAGPIFTDDWAPIEQITNSMVVQFVLEGNLDQLRP